jgi:prepilin-type N-terminal cleavage/methylation domain
MKIKNINKGMSLIELVVALAILTLIMTAVISMMSNNTIIFRKTKNDIKVQTQADESYSRISDIIMQSKYIYVEGKVLNEDLTFESGDVGKSYSGGTLTATGIKAKSANGVDVTGVYKFSDDQVNDKKIYVDKMVIVATVPIDSAVMDLGSVNSDGNFNYYQISGYGPEKTAPGAQGFDDADASIKYTGANASFLTNSRIHKIAVGDTDRCKYTLYFYEGDIFMKTEYMYMTKLNSITTSSEDPSTWTDDEKAQLRISNSLNYVKDKNDTKVEGFVATFDSARNCVGIEMYFNDTHMTYTVNNIVKAHNNYVISEFKGN